MESVLLKNFAVNLEKYSGPLDVLLSLIENRKMEITEISLAKVTNDFLFYLGDVKKAESGLLADFLTVAAKLLLIKSKALLPNIEISKEEEEEIIDFTKRLEIYKIFKEAGKHIREIYGKKQMFSKEFLIDQNPIFYPPKNITAEDLLNAFDSIWLEFKKLEEETIIEKTEKIVKIEEKIKEILNILNEKTAIIFSAISSKKEKKEAIVNFLAILQMFKEKIITIEQQDEFGEIQLKISNN